VSAPLPTLYSHTASDGYVFHYRRWLPLSDAPRRGRVVCLHGIQSHGGWYEQSCQHLSAAGFPVFFLDRRGAGLNQKARGDTPHFKRLLDDVAEFIDARRAEDPELDTHLVCISWGGKLGVALNRRHPGLFDSLALVCPGLFPRVGLPLYQRLAIFALRFLRPTTLFTIPLSEAELFTATPRWLEFLRKDPLSLRLATARFLYMSVRLDLYLSLAPRFVRVPTLLLLAGRDRIIDNARTRRFVERFASPDRSVVEYPDAHHTLEFEPEASAFLSDLTAWLLRVDQEKSS
jgi:alpha-beta hydrolase superfamily lysophospholipase